MGIFLGSFVSSSSEGCCGSTPPPSGSEQYGEGLGVLLKVIVVSTGSFNLLEVHSGDYGNDSSKYGYDGIPADSPQPKPKGEVKPEYGSKSKGEEKSNYGTKPGIYKPKPEEKPGYDRKPEGEVKLKYSSKPDGEEKPSYGAKPGIYKPKPKEKSGYDKKPQGEEKPNYGTKQYNYKSKPEEKEKKVVRPKPEGEEKPNYDTKPESYKPKPEENKKPEYGTRPEENEKLLSIGVEGLVLCKSGPKYCPIQGALAKVTCKAVDEIGLEKTLPICSVPTDAKGYLFTTLSSLSLVDKSLKLKDCKAFLESSPLKTCNVPTDVNKGITGAPSSSYSVLNEKHTKLYSVGPFFFASEPKSVPNDY
ncbi:hypothetical protein CRYUN_Cryun26dG0119100 [Craigia yunnanensis]